MLPPTPQLRRYLLIASALALALTCQPGPAEASTVHVRTQTALQAQQYQRSDTTLAAPRVFAQSLMITAADLRGNGTGDLTARLSLRYQTDFGLPQRLRADPLFEARFNDITLDLAYLSFRPTETLTLTAGRHWAPSNLGLTDLDGLTVQWRASEGDVRPFVGASVGRDVQRGLTPFDPGLFDVQGLPPNDAALSRDAHHLVTQARAGAQLYQVHRVELSSQYFRRPHAQRGTSRVGASASSTPFAPLTLSAAASYHSTAAALDRVHLSSAARQGPHTFTLGVDQRRPIFDSASIFNLFGAQPHRSGYVAATRRFDPGQSVLEVRTWTRLYFDEDPGAFHTGDARALGAALAGNHRLRVTIPLHVSWQVSGQTFSDATGGDQYLADLRLRAPLGPQGLYATGRLLGLWATPSHHRRPGGQATTAVVGMELAIADWGRLNLALEARAATFSRGNTAAFALFEVDAWR